jgi:hypothetical protein
MSIEAKLFKAIYDLASEQFANAGCNDFHLTRDADLTGEEVAVFNQALFDLGLTDELHEGPYTTDGLVLEWVKARIEACPERAALAAIRDMVTPYTYDQEPLMLKIQEMAARGLQGGLPKP